MLICYEVVLSVNFSLLPILDVPVLIDGINTVKKTQKIFSVGESDWFKYFRSNSEEQLADASPSFCWY